MPELAGNYRLVDWRFTLDGKGVGSPFGDSPTGLLTYTADGRMWAALMCVDRPPLATRSLAQATQQARADAASGYLSYAGSYRVEGDAVLHRVEVSLFPDWVGTEQRRLFSWEDGELVLRTPQEPTSNGRIAENALRWRRIGGTDE